MDSKQRVAQAVIQHLKDGMVVGLGTGTTAHQFHIALAAAIKSGSLKNIRCVPTSLGAETHARQLGIPLTTLADCPTVDVTVDGADEIDPHLNLIKGLGGALLREKIVAQNSTQMIVIADSSKIVQKLGTRSALPVEVTPFSYETHATYIRKLGGEPVLRLRSDDSPFCTDNGNYIYDCRFGLIDDPLALHTALRKRAGVVETGLFVGLATLAVVSDGQGVREVRAA